MIYRFTWTCSTVNFVFRLEMNKLYDVSLSLILRPPHIHIIEPKTSKTYCDGYTLKHLNGGDSVRWKQKEGEYSSVGLKSLS